MPRTYYILQGMYQGERKQVLVEDEDFKSSHLTHEDYFRSGTTEVKKIGEVEITGDADELDNVFVAQF